VVPLLAKKRINQKKEYPLQTQPGYSR
jgi:protoheme ferro-lyase